MTEEELKECFAEGVQVAIEESYVGSHDIKNPELREAYERAVAAYYNYLDALDKVNGMVDLRYFAGDAE